MAIVQRLDPNDEVQVPTEAGIEALSRRGRRLRSAIVPATARLAAMVRRADVVVNGSEIGVGLVLSWVAARLARKPLVVAVHADLDAALTEWMPVRLHWLFYWLHRHVTGAICVSPDLVAPLIRNRLAPDWVLDSRHATPGSCLMKELEASDVRDDWRQSGRSTSVS